jgi:hypothetical protein
VLPKNEEANIWRASLFAGILRVVIGSQTGAEGTAYATMFHDNVKQVSQDLVDNLRYISSGPLNPRIFDSVQGIMRSVGILALQMGSQRAHITLVTCGPPYEDRFPNPGQFNDENGSATSGMEADLMIQPCLKRDGDRDSSTSSKVIVHGEYVSLRSRY